MLTKGTSEGRGGVKVEGESLKAQKLDAAR